MTPTTHRITVKTIPGESSGHEIVFYDWGNPDAQRVTICVHGLTRNARDFDFLATQLAATGRRVLAINIAGRGESAWLADPMGYHYATYVADCLAVLDNFHLREVEWIGTSMGGIIGMMIAAQFPSRISKLVINDIGSYLSAAALTRIYDYVRTMPASFTDRAAAETYLRAAFAPWAITDATLWQRFVESSLTAHDGAWRYACDPAIAVPLAAASNHFSTVQDVNLSPIWTQVQAPTLLLHGADSDVLRPETIQAMHTTHLGLTSISFPGIGHAPALMDTSQTTPILNWLDRSIAGIMATSF